MKFGVLAVLLLSSLFAFAQKTPAGTEIPNQAHVFYTDGSGLASQGVSNEVVVTAAISESLTLLRDQSVVVKAGNQAVFTHTLSNTGNTSAQYTVTVVGSAGTTSAGPSQSLSPTVGSFTPSNVKLYVDSNKNGQLDGTDAEVSGPVSLDMDGSVVFFAVADVPANAVPGSVAEITITAVSGTQGTNASNVDTITVAGSQTYLLKSVDVTSAKQNELVTYTLETGNKGTGDAGAISVTVDGTQRALVIVRDVVPANATFAKVVEAANAVVLFHLSGDSNPTNFISVAPSDLSTIDAIAFGFQPFATGSTYAPKFSVKVNANASGALNNNFELEFTDNGAQRKTSNSVVTTLPTVHPTVAYFTSDFAKTVTVGTIGAPLFVQADASACNLKPLLVETQKIRIVTSLSGDDETFTATEISPNSGIFRVLPNVLTVDANTVPAEKGNGKLEVKSQDKLTASVECGGQSVAAVLLLDPAGVVFDSSTNLPILGAVVSLIDVTGQGNGGKAGQPATVLALDAVTPAASTVTTGADGRFQFPMVPASTYRFTVKVPNGFKVPSTVAPQALPAGRMIDARGSYLSDFVVDAATGTVLIDVPADPAPMSGLFVQKKASKTVAELGDFVDYEVQVKNNTGKALPSVTLNDELPVGVKYESNSARRENKRIADPTTAGRILSFSLGALADQETIKISYRVLLGAGTNTGKVLNTAQAVAGRTTSNIARAIVEVQGGNFDSRGFIVGQVTTKCADASGTKSLAVPGVRVLIEDGTYAITDAHGRYSLYGLRAQTHIVKVDGYTLPKGSTLLSTGARNARDGDSMFVDMKFGELRRADFQVACTADVQQLIEQRLNAFKAAESSISGLMSNSFNADVRVMPTQATQAGGAASGTVGRSSMPDFSTPVKKTTANNVSTTASAVAQTPAPGAASTSATTANNVASTQADSPAANANRGDVYEAATTAAVSDVAELKSVEKDLDDSLGFATIKDGQIIQVPQLNVWVKGPAESDFHLKVNGVEVSKERVGSKANFSDRKVEAWQYIGVPLKVGKNSLTVSAADPFGNQRSTTINVTVPDEIAKIVITVPQKAVQADGYSIAHVKVAVFDKQNLPVKTSAQLTLETSGGEWRAKDYDAIKPGVQTFIQGGAAEIPLIAPLEPGDVKIKVSTQQFTSEAIVTFVPEMRPVTAAGIAEYELNFRGASKSIEAVSGMEGFEEQLRLFSADNDTVQTGSRTAFFLKGKVLGSNLLTMSYDSNRTSGDRLFRDIQPDQFYPVYGDASVRGFDAQSTSKLFFRVDNGKSYLLYGDFQTAGQFNSTSRVLTNYSRSLTGVKQHFEGEKLNVSTFASYDTFTQVVEEFAANGTSGPYTFSHTNGLENSEKVEILTRDRNQLAMILDRKTQSRFSDYEFEPFTGRLIFKSPIATLDENGNPQFIRVTYEVDQGGERFWTGGIDSSYDITKNFKVGTIAVADSNPEDANQLYGLNTSIKLFSNATLSGELAASHRELFGSGVGYRVEYKQNVKRFEANGYLGRTSQTFKNQSSMLNEGRGEAGGSLRYSFTKSTRFIGEFLRSEDVRNGGTQVGGTAGVEHQFPHKITVKVDVRHSEQSAAQSQLNSVTTDSTLMTGGQDTTSSSSIPLTTQVAPNAMTVVGANTSIVIPKLRNTKFSADLQQDVTDADKHSFALGVVLPVSTRGKVYARHEFLSSLGSMYNLNGLQSRQATVVGVDFDYYKNAHAFSEYREGNDLNNRQTEAAIGLRNLFQVRKDLGVTAGIESIRTFSGTERNSFAVTTGFEFKPAPDLRASGKFEFRNSTTTNSYLTTFALGKEVSQHLTLLSRNVFLRDTSKSIALSSGSETSGDTLASSGTGTSRNQARFQVGAAFRGGEGSNWDVLSMAEYRIQDNNASSLSSASRLAIFSTNFNYQPAGGFSMSGRYSTKWNMDMSNDRKSDAFTQLLSIHVTRDLGKRMDAGFNANLLSSGGFSTRKQGLGAEIGYQLKQNLWLSSGYNLLGFSERDLPGGLDARQGAFVRLRFKFDEKIFKPNPRQQAAPTSIANREQSEEKKKS